MCFIIQQRNQNLIIGLSLGILLGVVLGIVICQHLPLGNMGKNNMGKENMGPSIQDVDLYKFRLEPKPIYIHPNSVYHSDSQSPAPPPKIEPPSKALQDKIDAAINKEILRWIIQGEPIVDGTNGRNGY